MIVCVRSQFEVEKTYHWQLLDAKKKKKKNELIHKGQPPVCGGQIHSCKFPQRCPIASSDVPLLVEAPLANPPLATTNLLHKHPEPITINPTPGNTPQPQACTKASFSITGESYCPTNRSFLSHKSTRPLNHYVPELGLFSQLRAPPASGHYSWHRGTGEIFVIAIAGYLFQAWWSLLW